MPSSSRASSGALSLPTHRVRAPTLSADACRTQHPLTLPVTHRETSRRRRPAHDGPRTSPPATRQRHVVRDPKRLHSKDPPIHHGDELRDRPKAATATPGWPPGRGFRHGFARTQCALGPGAPAVRRCPWATCRLSTSATGTGPRARSWTVQAPTLTRGHATAGRMAITLASTASQAVEGQGPARLSVAHRPAPKRPLAPRHLPQPSSTRTPLVANPCRLRCGTTSPAAPARYLGSFERACLASPCKHRGTVRAALRVSPRKGHARSRTQGALPRRATRYEIG